MHIDSFVQYLHAEKRYSQNTLAAYENDLKSFFQFLSDTYDISSLKLINHTMVRSWIVSMASDQLTNRTINRKISTLKTYFRYLRRNNLIDNNPMSRILSPKMSKSLPEFVSEENMEKLFEGFVENKNFESQRDKLIIELLYCTGIRANELVNLKEADINTENCQLKVMGKRNKERLVPFASHLKESIEIYREAKNREIIVIDAEFLLLTQKGKKIYKKLVYKVVNDYLSRVSTLKKKSPHILRHTFATHMLNNGADLNSIKELLGHANLSATQVYTHNTIEKLKSIYNQAHPRA